MNYQLKTRCLLLKKPLAREFKLQEVSFLVPKRSRAASLWDLAHLGMGPGFPTWWVISTKHKNLDGSWPDQNCIQYLQRRLWDLEPIAKLNLCFIQNPVKWVFYDWLQNWIIKWTYIEGLKKPRLQILWKKKRHQLDCA